MCGRMCGSAAAKAGPPLLPLSSVISGQHAATACQASELSGSLRHCILQSKKESMGPPAWPAAVCMWLLTRHRECTGREQPPMTVISGVQPQIHRSAGG